MPPAGGALASELELFLIEKGKPELMLRMDLCSSIVRVHTLCIRLWGLEGPISCIMNAGALMFTWLDLPDAYLSDGPSHTMLRVSHVSGPDLEFIMASVGCHWCHWCPCITPNLAHCCMQLFYIHSHTCCTASQAYFPPHVTSPSEVHGQVTVAWVDTRC